jgi:N-acetyl sugar amidotransferase
LEPRDKVVCSSGVWDETIPDISFDEAGKSNYADIFQRMLDDFPRGETGTKIWQEIVAKMRQDGDGKKYDCIIGVSGGTDSSYLLHFAKEQGLRPLAVYLDNGWASNVSVSNIKKLVEPLNIDLVTHVINYEEVKDVLKAYLKARLPWADSPTDLAIKAILYKTAHQFRLKYVLIGHDFRSEGFQPTEWTYSDDKQMRYLSKKFTQRKLNTFPNLTLFSFVYYSFVKKIKYVKPFFYIHYSKQEAKDFLIKNYNWEDYGGHHYENIYTKFIIGYWLYEKFGIDKRKITLSAQVLSGEVSRAYALEELKKNPYNYDTIQGDIEYVLKKLDMSFIEFDSLFKGEKKHYYDYPSYYPLYARFKKIIFYLIKYFLPNRPLMFYQMESRQKNKT